MTAQYITGLVAFEPIAKKCVAEVSVWMSKLSQQGAFMMMMIIIISQQLAHHSHPTTRFLSIVLVKKLPRI